MKILLATGIFPPDIGGPATYTERLAQEFKKRSLKVGVITYSDGINLEKQKIQDYNFPVTRISRKHPKWLRFFLYFLNLLWLARNYDLIYIQDLVAVGFPALMVSKILGKKLFVKIVGDYAWEVGKREGKVKENLEDFQNKNYGFKIEFLRKIQKLVAKKANKIITPSQYLKNIISGWKISEEKIMVIYNAVEPINFSISKEKVKKKIGVEGDIILSTGRLVPLKGFSVLIEIMPDLLKINPNFKLVIVGEGEEEKNLKFKISNLKLEENVKLVGKVNHKEIPFYFRASDIFVLNSEHEGLSHVILEAMQFGVPVIASNRGGNLELIKDGYNGFLIEYNNKEQIKNAILNLWQDKNIQKKFVENSKETLRKFNWENLVEKTLGVLKSV